MKTKILETKASDANLYETRVNAVVRYGKDSYAVSITTYHDFKGNTPVIESINSFKYLTSIRRQSSTRDEAIKRALKGLEYQY